MSQPQDKSPELTKKSTPVERRFTASIEDLSRLLPDTIDIRSVALTGIFLLGILYSLYFARAFILPIVVAFLLNMLLAPFVRLMKRYRVPEALSAAIVILSLLVIVGYGIYRLSGPAAQWIQTAPQTINRAQAKLRGVLKPVEEVQKTTKKIEKMTTFGDDKSPTVEIKKPGLGEIVFTGTQEFLVGAGVTVILLYFLLASGDLFLLKLVKVLPSLEDKKRAVEISRQIEKNVSVYLSTVTLVNLGLGVAIGTAMHFLGLPNGVLWGVMGAFLNFIPYVGAFVGIVIVTITAIVTLDDPIRIMAVPAVYFGLNVIEAYMVTPMMLSRTLALNPVVILMWLIFWGWIWGVGGALLAVPMLAVLKIVCDHLQPLAPIGEFLGTESRSVV